MDPGSLQDTDREMKIMLLMLLTPPPPEYSFLLLKLRMKQPWQIRDGLNTNLGH